MIYRTSLGRTKTKTSRNVLVYRLHGVCSRPAAADARRITAAPAAFGRDLVQVGQHLELSRANAVERTFTEYENSAQHSTTKVRSVLAFGCLSLLFAWPQQQPLRPPELRRLTNQ